MNNSSFNYVRTFRQRYGLNERELAFLINQRSHTAVSRIEVGDRVPDLEGSLALQVVFRQPPHRVFPGFYELVEEGVMRRAVTLIAELAEDKSERSGAKRAFLESLARPDESDAAV
jgi:transcriptional regulator with XRE-family HTH domain